MAFKLLQECEKRWIKIRGAKQIEKLLSGVEFKDGVVVPSQQQIEEAVVI